MSQTGKRVTDYPKILTLDGTDAFLVEAAEGTKNVQFEDLCKVLKIPTIEEVETKFPEIDPGDPFPMIVGKLKKWQADTIAKVETYILQTSIIESYPEEPEEEKLKKQVIAASLALKMQQAIDKVAKDVTDLTADCNVQKREQMAPYGYYGKEWNIDELMELVKASAFEKFAVGDFFTETTTTSEKLEEEVAGKQPYLYCGDQGSGLTSPHIVCIPRDCHETLYKYNNEHTNAGGYAASLMPDNLEAEANKFSAKLQSYMTQIRRLENNKGGWAWASRRIFLPGIVELCGSNGFADGYSGGAFNQLPLFAGGNRHLLKGRGYQKKTAARMWYWTADPSAAFTTSFCHFGGYGNSYDHGAADDGAVAPAIVLS